MKKMPKRVTKVVLFAYRKHEGDYEFFLVTHDFGTVALTGHVGDVHKHESLSEAAIRETQEEVGVLPLSIVDLGMKVEVELARWEVISTEHAFLVELPDRDFVFLEQPVPSRWVKISDLEAALDFENQRRAVPLIRRHLLSPAHS